MGYYAVDRYGHKFPVDVSSAKEDDFILFDKSGCVFSDDTILRPRWRVTVETGNPVASIQNYEYAGEKFFDKKPSKADILQTMAQFGAGINDICTVEKVYMQDYWIDDYGETEDSHPDYEEN